MKRIDAETFIRLVRNLGDNDKRYDYSETVFLNLSSKVQIYCRRCEAYFWQDAKTHLRRNAQCKCYSNQHLLPSDYLERAKTIAAERGGLVVSTEYLNSDTPLRWRCSCGTEWNARLSSVEKKGTWCPSCGREKSDISRRKTTENFISRLRTLHGETYGYEKVVYSGVFERVEMFCHKCNAYFSIVAHSALNGAGCQRCKNIDIGNKNRKYDLDQMHAIAARFGGKLLSTEFTNTNNELEWMCSQGHIFKRPPQLILANHTWCDVCNVSYKRGEKIVRLYLEALFGVGFRSVRPSWLRHNKGFPLELDGLNETIGIAFEHQGVQHEKNIPHFHRAEHSFKSLQERDAFKAKKCVEYGIRLIVVPELFRKLLPEELPAFIASESERLGLSSLVVGKPSISAILQDYYQNYDYPDYETAKAVMSSFNIRTKAEFQEFVKSDLMPKNLPKDVFGFYSTTGTWKSWPDFLGASYVGKKSSLYWDYGTAREYVGSLGLRSRAEWEVWVQTHDCPVELPKSPLRVYRRTGEWISWSHWLSFDHVATNAKQPVLMYAHTGEKLSRFASASEAGEVLHLLPSHISNCCRGKRPHTGGFQWRYESEHIDALEPLKTFRPKNRPIVMVGPDNRVIKRFDSTKAAAKELNIEAYRIRFCLQGRTKTYFGHSWKYAET